MGKKKDSPRGKECFGVREFTVMGKEYREATRQERCRSHERQRVRRDTEVARGNVVEIPKLLEATWQEKKSRSCYDNVAGEILKLREATWHI